MVPIRRRDTRRTVSRFAMPESESPLGLGYTVAGPRDAGRGVATAARVHARRGVDVASREQASSVGHASIDGVHGVTRSLECCWVALGGQLSSRASGVGLR